MQAVFFFRTELKQTTCFRLHFVSFYIIYCALKTGGHYKEGEHQERVKPTTKYNFGTLNNKNIISLENVLVSLVNEVTGDSTFEKLSVRDGRSRPGRVVSFLGCTPNKRWIKRSRWKTLVAHFMLIIKTKKRYTNVPTYPNNMNRANTQKCGWNNRQFFWCSSSHDAAFIQARSVFSVQNIALTHTK